jgi:VIT1/CCC1 family predicted Fe2+/Mn2+ transporter
MQEIFRRVYGKYIRDAVYAASDGIVTTFTIVAGVTGAELSPAVILILGFANVFADGISMAAGSYLGTKSESDHYKGERAREERIFNRSAEDAEHQVKEIFLQNGYTDKDAQALAPLLVKNKEFFLDFTIFYRKGFHETKTSDAINGAIVTLIAFMIAGTLPLLPYIVIADAGSSFLWATVFTGIAMFLVGSMRTLYSEKKWWKGGLEMFLVAGIAAATAYFIGAFLSNLI